MDHSSEAYVIPPFLTGICTPQVYLRWLDRKAKAHVKRDRERGNDKATTKEYKRAIHQAVERSGGFDEYTGLPLQWDRISKYNNTESGQRGREYKKKFGDLPTVDHVGDGLGPADFCICSWRVNDAKNDLTLAEFLDVCRAVLAHHEKVAKRRAELKATSGKVEFEANWQELETLELGELDFLHGELPDYASERGHLGRNSAGGTPALRPPSGGFD
jgi:hypothetical protein